MTKRKLFFKSALMFLSYIVVLGGILYAIGLTRDGFPTIPFICGSTIGLIICYRWLDNKLDQLAD